MQVSQDFIQKLKNSITISEFLQKYITLIPAGHNRYKALCPFHNEKTPSFVINDERQLYHCFGCNAHGDVISFLTEKEGYDFIDAVKYIAESVGMTIPVDVQNNQLWIKDKQDFEILEEINNFFRQELFKYPEMVKYLSSRQVGKKLIDQFQIGYAPPTKVMDKFVSSKKYNIKKLVELGIYKLSDKQQPYFLFHNRIIFPIYNHFGQVVAFGGRIVGQGQPKYLNSPEHRFFKKREILFNLYHAKSEIKKQKTAIICEGYMDVVAMHNSAIRNVVAPLGTAFSETHLQVLWKHTDKSIMCLDGDEAGRKAMLRAAHIAIPYLQPGKSLLFVILPSGKDPDDLLNEAGGKEELQRLINDEAVSLGEILLSEVVSNRSFDLPEERAAIVEELNNYADKISNNLVKKQYLQYFNQACFNLFRQKKYKFSKVKSNIELKESSISRKELDLVLFVCFNIEELAKDSVEEEFSLIEFGHEELIKIQMYLLSVSEEFEIGKFKIWVSENIVELKDYILRIMEDMEKVRKVGSWQFFYKSYYLEKLQNDYRYFSGSQDPEEYNKSTEILNSIKELKIELDRLLALSGIEN